MRRSTMLLLLSLALLVGGLLLMFALPGDDESVYFGWAAEADATLPPVVLLLTTEFVVGTAMIWSSTLIAVGTLVHRRATRSA